MDISFSPGIDDSHIISDILVPQAFVTIASGLIYLAPLAPVTATFFPFRR
jgi:hypothetical protein